MILFYKFNDLINVCEIDSIYRSSVNHENLYAIPRNPTLAEIIVKNISEEQYQQILNDIDHGNAIHIEDFEIEYIYDS